MEHQSGVQVLLKMQSSRPRPLSAGLVKEYMYCPVIAWFKANGLFREEVTPSMELGSRANLESIAEEYNLPKPRLYETMLYDEELRLRGRPDIVAGSKWRVVVEVKVFDRPIEYSTHFREQARVYAFLAERVLGRVEKYAVIIGSEMHSWEYTYYDHEHVINLINEVRRCLSKPEPPEPTLCFKCTYCFYRRLCPYATGSFNETLVL